MKTVQQPFVFVIAAILATCVTLASAEDLMLFGTTKGRLDKATISKGSAAQVTFGEDFFKMTGPNAYSNRWQFDNHGVDLSSAKPGDYLEIEVTGETEDQEPVLQVFLVSPDWSKISIWSFDLTKLDGSEFTKLRATTPLSQPIKVTGGGISTTGAIGNVMFMTFAKGNSHSAWTLKIKSLAVVSGDAKVVVPVAVTVAPQKVTLDTSAAGRKQIIDGFGTCGHLTNSWYQKLYFDDLRCSIVRVDITPHFKSPWSDQMYNAPWFNSKTPMPGPETNNVRTYTSAADYTREYAGRRAQIAIMGPDIDDNIHRYFDYESDQILKGAGLLARLGTDRRQELGDLKLLGCVWSPPPWLKIPSGNRTAGWKDPLPKDGTPWPFIWHTDFAGGMLDISGELRAEFNDAELPGGKGPTSALTQYARAFAAWVRGFQNTFGVKFYAISLQNEPHLELFYNSCLYRTADQYIAALKAARAELDKYPDLKDIRLIGPEETIGSESTYLWTWPRNGFQQQMSLQMMKSIEADPVAAKALAFYCVHGYSIDGIASAGSEPMVWEWSARGWSNPPNPVVVPPNVKGYESFGKTCWMTETSGDRPEWLYPTVGFPNRGAFSIALKIHQALTVGDVPGWIYWLLSNMYEHKADYRESLTKPELGDNSPKLAAVRHFFRYIRPGARRIEATIAEWKKLKVSAYLDEKNGTLVWVLINAGKETVPAQIVLPTTLRVAPTAEAFLSTEAALWQSSAVEFKDGQATIEMPSYSVVTLVGKLAQ